MGSGHSRILKKRWLRLAALLAGILFAMVCAAWLRLPEIAQRVARHTLEVPVSIGDLSLSFHPGTLRIENLTIGQPPGFGDKPLLTVETIVVRN